MPPSSASICNRLTVRLRHLLCSVALLGVIAPAHAQVAVERLCLFAEHSGVVAAHTAEGGAASGAADFAALGVQASASQDTSGGQRSWVWSLKNTSGKNLSGARISAFLDADIQAAENTFFNEAATPDAGVGAQPSTATEFYPDRWEVGEPGYWSGELLVRAAAGKLKNQIDATLGAADDAALALSLAVPDWPADKTLTVTATLADGATGGAVLGLAQSDAASGAKLHFALHARLGAGGGGGGGGSGGSGSGPAPVPGLGLPGLLLLTLGLAAAAWRARRVHLAAILVAIAAAFPAGDAHAIFVNGGFEEGDFTGWQEGWGWNPGLGGSQPYDHSSIVIHSGGQRLLQLYGRAFDPHAPHLVLPRVGEYVARLNDAGGGKHINYITQSGTITEDDRDAADGKLHVRFSYAAVLQDPNHGAHDQPYFHVLLTDLTTGDILYEDFAYAGQPGRLYYTTYYNGTWQATPFIDVDMPVPDSSLGHEVQVRVLAADCSRNAHGGYVYVDAFGSQRIPPQNMCLTDLAARAKPGKVQLTWTDNGAARYAIYRATELKEGAWRRVGETDSRHSTWLDTNVQAGQTYFYSVRALDAGGNEQCASGAAAAVPPPEWELGKPLHHPPRITSQPQTTGSTLTAWGYQVIANDPDGTALSYELPQAPQGMSISADGQLDWTPAATATGSHHVTIVVRNAAGLVASQSFALEVTDGRLPPVIDAQSLPLPGRIPAGKPFAHQVTAKGANGAPLIYSIGSQADGLRISNTGRITWDNPQLGRYPYTVIVADTLGARTTLDSTLIVTGPEFQTTPPEQAYVGREYRYPAKAVDPEGGDIAYTLSYNNTGSSVTLDRASGLLTWTPTRTGAFTLEVTATGTDGAFVRQRWSVTVTDAPNEPPVITSTPAVQAVVGQTYTYDIEASDPEGAALDYKLDKAPNGATLTGQRIEWTPTQTGLYDFAISVSDSKNPAVTQSWSVGVNAAANQPPVITNKPATSTTVGASYVYDIEATDPDGDTPLTYTLDKAPAGAKLDGQHLTWTAPAQAGLYEFAITVSDGKGGEAKLGWTVAVNAVQPPQPPTPGNRAPFFTSTPEIQAIVGQQYVYDITATDPDGDTPLDFKLDTAPQDAQLAGQRLTWTPAQAGLYDFAITVRDIHGAGQQQRWSVGVNQGGQPPTPGNRTPVITSTPVYSASVGATYSYQVTAKDDDGDPLTYKLDAAPAGMGIDASGLISWTPAATGSEQVTVRVSDDKQAWASQSWTITITPQVAPLPLSASISLTPRAIAQNASTTLTVQPSGGTAPYTLRSLTVDGAAHPFTGLTATITGSSLGRHTVSATIADSKGATFTAEDWFSVTDGSDDDDPIARITAPASSDNIEVADVTAPVAITGTASDRNFAEYELLISPSGKEQWTRLALGNKPVTDGTLGNFNPQAIANGLYDIGLIVRDLAGKEASARITIAVTAQQKAAPLRLTFEDMAFELEGLPLGVTRSYDSLRRFEHLDFGWGWSVQWQDATVQTNGIVGRQWSTQQIGGGFNRQICARPAGSRVVAVRLPGGKIEQFEAHAEPECQSWMQFVSGLFVTVKYTPRGKNHSGATLEALGYGASDLQIVGDSLFDVGGGEPYNPSQWKYTTLDGQEYILGEGGIQQVKDRQGNTLQFTKGGVKHSGGWSLQFARDAGGRITSITGPGGLTRRYHYDAAGRLIAAEEPDGTQANYAYKDAGNPNALTDWTDPAGRLMLRAEYDAEGRIVKQTDAQGNAVNVTHEPGTQTVTDRLGRTTSYTFDARGNITQVTDAAGGITKYTYDDNDNETSETDPLGRTTTREFDAYGNPTKETDPLGRATTTAYNAQGNVTQVAMPGGMTHDYGYNQSGQLTSLTTPGGSKSAIGYSVQGSLSSLADPLGRSSKWSYAQVNGASLMQSSTAPDGAVTTYTHDAQGRITGQSTSTTLAAGEQAQTASTKTEYDANGNPTRSTNALGHSSTSRYNAAGDLIEETSPLGLVTRHSYNERGEKTQTTHPDGTVETWEYDAEGQETKHCSAAQGVPLCEETTYDQLGRAVENKDAAGGISKTGYDAAGQVTSTTDELNRTSRYEYDAAGRQTRSTDPLGGTTETTYTEAGHVASTKAADGSTTSYEYDAAGRRTKTLLPGGASHSSAYDAAGQKTSDTDEAGHTTSYAYDAAGRLAATILPSAAETKYTWNEAGQLLAQTDARGNTTKYGYDLAGRRVSRTLADGSTEQLAYDADGKLTARQYFDGSKVQYTFDAGGRATGETRPDGQTTIGYDQHGRANSHSDTARGSINHSFDAVGRQTKEITQTAEGESWQASTTWDAAGQRTAVSAAFTNQASHRIDAAWDAGGRLQTLTDTSGTSIAAASFTHDAAGRLTKIERTGGATSTYAYNQAGHLTGITHANSNGKTLATFAYERDAKGRLAKATETIGTSQTTKTWEYDADGKLTKETATSQGLSTSCAYQYDAVGNRTQRDCDGQKTTYSYNQLDQLTQETTAGKTTAYKYDGRGNLIEKKTAGATISYTWSSDNRLTQVSDGTTTVKYDYDALGRRISRTQEAGSNKTETQWILDTARPYSEIITERTRTNGGAWSATSYTHTPDGVGLLIAETRNGQTRHIYADAQGSTRLVTDASGNALETLGFDAFGNENAGSTKEARHRYTGESYDATTGLYHLRARDYDPATGRFISMDEHPGSQRIPLSLNKYLYGNADPVNTIDPSGNMALAVTMTTVVPTGWSRQQEAGVKAGIGVQIKKRLFWALVRYGHIASALIKSDVAVKSEVERCLKIKFKDRGSDCGADTTTLIVGDDNDQVQGHILRAQARGYPAMVTKRAEPWPREWRRKYIGPGKDCPLSGGGYECDEYPMAIHEEGGEDNHPSLASVSAKQNGSVGGKAAWLHRHCQVVAGGRKYLVAPVPGISVTGYVCGR